MGLLDAPSLTPTRAATLYFGKWQAGGTYAAGTRVLSPTGDVVEAATSFTAGSVYDASKWRPIVPANPFRYDSTRLIKLRTAVALGSANIAVVGDSISEGYGASANSKRWIEIMRDKLRARWQPAGITGGEGYVPSFYVSSTMTQRAVGSFGVYTQRTDLAGLGMRLGILGVGGSYRDFTFTGTGVDILYTKGTPAGAGTWAIDGGTATTFNTNDPTLTAGQRIQVRGLTAGSHTLRLTATTGGNGIYFEGLVVYNGDETSGIRVFDGGHSGWQTDDYVTGGNGDLWYGTLNTIAPDCVLIFLGVNDWRSGSQTRLTAAQTKANLQTMISKIRSMVTSAPSIALLIPYTATDPGGTPEAWIDYRQAIHDTAQADGKITLIDLDPILAGGFGNFTDPYGLNYGTDYLHPNDKGHALLGSAIADVLLHA